MSKRVKIMAVAACLFMMAGAFCVGRYVQADVLVGEPGSSQDPLVTQSYVDSQLQAQVQALQAQITALQNRVAALEAQQGSGGISPTIPSPTTPTAPTQPTTPVVGSKKVSPAGTVRINVRSGPGTNYSIVGKLEPNTWATLISTKNDWYYIQMSNGKYGWVSKSVTKLK